jgi:uncharacterized protein (DUF1330 family)
MIEQISFVIVPASSRCPDKSICVSKGLAVPDSRVFGFSGAVGKHISNSRADSRIRHCGVLVVHGQVRRGVANMIVIVEFPNLEQARAWYRSPEYAFALEVRDTALSRNLILIDGVPL